MAERSPKTAGSDPSTIPAFEERLFPVFQFVLENVVAEFMPYVYEIMALLLELQPSGVTSAYAALLPNLTVPVNNWITPDDEIIEGNITPLVRLIEVRWLGPRVRCRCEPVVTRC